MESSPTISASEERIWAALAHGSVILFGWGLVIPAVIWATQRRKSTFVAFQTLQALTYQLAQMVYWVLMALFIVIVAAVLIFGLTIFATSSNMTNPWPIIAIQMLVMLVLVGAFGLYMLGGLAGAAGVLMGRNFRYPLLGSWLERYLAEPSEDRSARYMAGLSHIAALMPFLGLVAPLVAWLSERKHSPLLRFQALQALIYQGVGALLGALLYLCQIIAPLGLMIIPFLMLPFAQDLQSSVAGPWVILMIFFFLMVMGLGLIQLVGAPLFALYGVYGGWRVIQGADFRYPVISRWAASRPAASPLGQAVSNQRLEKTAEATGEI